jgi:hypothetical protein
MGDEMDLEQAHEFYKNPANLVPAGPGRRPQRPATMSGTVPVRFSPDMIMAVRRLADQDGVTVSSWIRGLVSKEIQRRQLPSTDSAAAAEPVQLDYPPEFRPQSESLPSSVRELVCIA